MPSGHGCPAIWEVGQSEAPQASAVLTRWGKTNVPARNKTRQDPLNYNLCLYTIQKGGTLTIGMGNDFRLAAKTPLMGGDGGHFDFCAHSNFGIIRSVTSIGNFIRVPTGSKLNIYKIITRTESGGETVYPAT